ncbi:hypothetical protein [Halopenitus persicus]|uniref:Uncharacterized protein n=1 Tax=Halopenitus persicus TaxID=1048396 RepID=A0A1H3K1T3_9EURY|nr:hypothetical protein [Halopenitus persicus]SDY46121.1 hypothetical protein SAMN05216564_105225 [Halopenitus persicus]
MSPSRRRLLRTALSGIALGVGTAGCLDAADSGSTSDRPAGPNPSSGTETDPPVRKPRNPGGRSVLREADATGTPSTGSGNGNGSETGTGNGTRTGTGARGEPNSGPAASGPPVGAVPGAISRELIVDADRVPELAFADGVPADAAASARSFLEATDFETQSVFFRTFGIESCERFRIHSVSWERDHVEFEYCRELRPPDRACTADAWDAVGLFIRLPVTFRSPTALSGSGASGRSPCRNVDTRYDRIDANATVEGSPTVVDPTDAGSTDIGSTDDQPTDSATVTVGTSTASDTSNASTTATASDASDGGDGS